LTHCRHYHEDTWEDRTPFDAIEYQFGVPEKDVIQLMREAMKLSSWKIWRKRVQFPIIKLPNDSFLMVNDERDTYYPRIGTQ